MNHETIEKIKSLQTHFNALFSGSTIKLSRHEVNLVGEIWSALEPGKRLNLACGSCVEVTLQKIAVKWEQYQQQIKEPLTTNTTKKIKTKNGI